MLPALFSANGRPATLPVAKESPARPDQDVTFDEVLGKTPTVEAAGPDHGPGGRAEGSAPPMTDSGTAVREPVETEPEEDASLGTIDGTILVGWVPEVTSNPLAWNTLSWRADDLPQAVSPVSVADPGFQDTSTALTQPQPAKPLPTETSLAQGQDIATPGLVGTPDDGPPAPIKAADGVAIRPPRARERSAASPNREQASVPLEALPPTNGLLPAAGEPSRPTPISPWTLDGTEAVTPIAAPNGLRSPVGAPVDSEEAHHTEATPGTTAPREATAPSSAQPSPNTGLHAEVPSLTETQTPGPHSGPPNGVAPTTPLSPAATTAAAAGTSDGAPPVPNDGLDAADLLRQLEVRLAPRRPELTVVLDPPDLGRLHVRLTMSAGELRATLTAEDARVARTIEADVGRLYRTLDAAGIRVSEVQVRTGLQPDLPNHSADTSGQGSSRASDSDQGRSQASHGHGGHDRRATPPALIPTERRTQPWRTTTLDLVV